MKVLLVVLFLITAVFGASLEEELARISAELDQVSVPAVSQQPPSPPAPAEEDAGGDSTPVGPPHTTLGVSDDIRKAAQSESDLLPPAEATDTNDAPAERSATIGGSSWDVPTLIGIVLGLFFAGVVVTIITAALFRRRNLKQHKDLLTEGHVVRDYHVPWEFYQVAILCAIMVTFTILAIVGGIAYVFASPSSSAPSVGGGAVSRAFILTPPNGPQPNWGAPCSNPNAPECIAAWLDITNKARAKERVRPMKLPANYAHLSIAEQNRVLVNLERKDRGLPGFPKLVGSLNRLALVGAKRRADPIGPRGKSWGSNWCGSNNAIMCNYLYMYWDGPGGTNIECKRGGEPGCWGHRKNIIRKWKTRRLHMGAAVSGKSSSTQLFVAG